jgi:hypothetical protein
MFYMQTLPFRKRKGPPPVTVTNCEGEWEWLEESMNRGSDEGDKNMPLRGAAL